MKNNKCPYQFPLKSRKAMVAYLADHDSYGGWDHPYRSWSPLSWCVKLYGFDTSGKKGEEQTTPELDDAWESYCETDHDLFSTVCEDMARTYTDGEYTTYPGNDQGDWKFTFAGRSGGHMLLESWQGLDFLKGWDSERWTDYLNEMELATLKTLYRAVACMDQDFTRAKLNEDAAYHMNYHRSQWEEQYKRDQSFELAKEGLEPCPCV